MVTPLHDNDQSARFTGDPCLTMHITHVYSPWDVPCPSPVGILSLTCSNHARGKATLLHAHCGLLQGHEKLPIRFQIRIRGWDTVWLLPRFCSMSSRSCRGHATTLVGWEVGEHGAPLGRWRERSSHHLAQHPEQMEQTMACHVISLRQLNA